MRVMVFEELSGYEKIKLILENYKALNDRLNYLKANIDNVKLKHSYNYDRVAKGFNSSYMSELEKIEDIKEKRLKTIDLIEYFLHLINAGIDYLKDCHFKYYEIIEFHYIKGLNLKKVASKLGISPATVSKNRDKLIKEIASFLFEDFTDSFNLD